MMNELGEEIPDSEVRKIAKRISELSREEIDQLFDEVGFVVRDHDGKKKPDNRQALFPDQIDEIKENGVQSGMVRNLLRESPLKSVLEELRDIESR
ncbi:MAG: hypothetical protein ABEJ72_06540 [Candidatus Aenigmatarchaeota archaeon]